MRLHTPTGEKGLPQLLPERQPKRQRVRELGSPCSEYFLPHLAPSQAQLGHVQVKPIVWPLPWPPVRSPEQAWVKTPRHKS